MNRLMNKEIFRKIILPNIIIIIIFMIIFGIFSRLQYNFYNKILNEKLSEIINNIKIKYPEYSDEEIIKTIKNNGKNNTDYNLLQKYGYTNDINYLSNINNTMKINIIINETIILLLGISIILIIAIYERKKEEDISNINKYLKELNEKNYELKIEENNENELSKLKNELYKTTVLLKESAEISEKEKINLSNSLADISHQLKTPITSIRIMLDNINDNPKMDEKTKTEFIKEISKQVDWVSSLTVSLLKLAKFDAGSIKMNDKIINIKDLIDDVIESLSILLDIKNIKIETEIDPKIELKLDCSWQKEAFTNIIKNAIEHSKENSKIHINVENSSVFLKIKIKDEGEGISKKDLKHIFERFYKSKNSTENSIGIGLALAKAIIEKDNGYIKVSSEEKIGTVFEIKYMK
jgi:signal transduction histidine kinase